MRKVIRMDAVVTALSSISHIGEVRGINAEFHREKIMLPDGNTERIPTLTGNSIRGQLRDAGARHMLRELGYGGDGSALPLSAFYFLFSGGALSKSGAGNLNVEQARDLADTMPFVALFGGAAGNHIMPGRLKIGKFIPIADETIHLIPSQLHPESTVSVYDYMQTEPYTRKDDAKDDRLREYLMLPGKQGDMFAVVPADDNAPQQMRYWVETICAGVRFYWHITLENVTDLEADAFIAALSEWGKNPTLGGKGSVGHGRVAVDFGNGLDIDPRYSIAPEAPESYTVYLRDNADRIREVLHGL
jgi:hypothetical protein